MATRANHRNSVCGVRARPADATNAAHRLLQIDSVRFPASALSPTPASYEYKPSNPAIDLESRMHRWIDKNLSGPRSVKITIDTIASDSAAGPLPCSVCRPELVQGDPPKTRRAPPMLSQCFESHDIH